MSALRAADLRSARTNGLMGIAGLRRYLKTCFFDQAVVAVQLVYKLTGVTEIVFFDDQQGILDLADLEQEGLFVIKEPDAITPESVGRWSDNDVSIPFVTDNSGRSDRLGSIPVI